MKYNGTSIVRAFVLIFTGCNLFCDLLTTAWATIPDIDHILKTRKDLSLRFLQKICSGLLYFYSFKMESLKHSVSFPINIKYAKAVNCLGENKKVLHNFQRILNILIPILKEI